MAISFGEIFLREMGSAQDRASNMAQLQLQANKFAAQQALAEAQFEVEKADAASVRSLRAFQQEVGRAQERRAEAQEGRAAKMFKYEEELAEINIDKAEYERDKTGLNLQTLKEQQEYLNSTISTQQAEKYNLPLTTTNQEFEIYLDRKLRETALEAEQTQLQATQTAIEKTAEAEQLSQEFTKQFIEMYNQPIAAEEAFQYAPKEQQISGIGKVARNFGSSLLGMMFPAPNIMFRAENLEDLPYYDPARIIVPIQQRLEREADLGITQEAQEEIIGRRPSELSGFTPQMLELMSRGQVIGTPFQTVFGATNILQQGAGIMNPTSFLQQVMQAQQQTLPEVEE